MNDYRLVILLAIPLVGAVAATFMPDARTTRRWALAVSLATFAVRIAATSSFGSMPESTASASFGPMPLTPINRSKICNSSVVANPYRSSASSRT